MHSWKIQYDNEGHFRIVKEGREDITSPWTAYRHIAILQDEGNTYMAVSAYFEGTLPVNKVMYINPQPTTTIEGVKRTYVHSS